MSGHLLIRAWVCCVLLLIVTPYSAMAQHGHELAADTCVLHAGPYKMLFASYLPDMYYDRKFCQDLPAMGNTVLVLDYVEQELRSLPVEVYDRKFCQDLPAMGNTVLVLDYVEQELRSLPVEVRIIRDTGSEDNLEAVTITHLPAKVYPTGSIDVKYNFDQPGKFVGLVAIGEKREHVARFSFSVGDQGVISHLSHYMMVIVPVFVGIAVAVFFAFRDRRKPSQIPVS
ncbi:MAG: hypothetical protein HP496_08905 [Nitrospira sp.]|nr:hypothetical protein [Nitrospira sp.]